MRGPFVAEAREAMATRFEILLPGDDRVRLVAAAEEALDEIDRLESQLSMYRVHSEVSGLNAYAAAGPVRVEAQLFALLKLALDVSRRTAGAFDLTIGPLLHAWGFAGGTGKLADPDEVAAARDVTGSELVLMDDERSTVAFAREGVRLDLGAIGKGYALDRAVEVLREAGIEAGLIHGGTSTVYGIGMPPGECAWKVALRHPQREEGEGFGEVSLCDRALSVSASHGKSFRQGDRLYGHVLDPRAGEPAVGALMAAVGHPSATLTDALSTALLILGAEGLPGLAAEYPEADFLLMTPAEGGVVLEEAGPGEWDLRLFEIL
jgi:FAD:protein FMN transferase